MPITIIAGRAGSGKSAKLYSDIKSLASRNRDVVLIVPEQFTLQAERELIASSGGVGYLSVNVMSITRLASEIFSTVQAPDKKVIDARGKSALMRQVTKSLQGELSVFSRAVGFSGFSSELSELIGVFKKYDVTIQKLSEVVKKDEQNTHKINDILKIYTAFDEHLDSKKYMDSDDKINLLIELIPNAHQYKDTHFFVDGFDRLTKQDLRVIQALLELSGNVTVCVNDDKLSDEDIFRSGKKSIDELYSIAKNCRQQTEILYTNQPHINKHPSILHLEKNLYSKHPDVYKGDCAISLVYASDMLNEAENAACTILSIIKNSNYKIKFDDISVLCCSNLNEYGPLLERIFDRYNIPCFTHRRKSMAQHPAVSYLLSCISAKLSGYSQNHVLAMLKSGYSGVAKNDALLFEDYVADNAIDKYLFDRALKRGAKRYDLEKINAIRDILINPLDYIKNTVLPAKSHLKNIFDMINKAGLKNTLLVQQQELLDMEFADYAAQTAQAWNTIIEIIEQLEAIFSDTPMTLEDILFALEESFISTQIGILPVTSDQVLIGELARTKLSSAKYLIVLGASEGSLPKTIIENAILNRYDVELLKKLDVDINLDIMSKRYQNDYSIYQALSTPSEGLIISYPQSSSDDIMPPSIIMDKIKDIFMLDIKQAQIDFTIAEAAALSVAASAFGAIGDGRMAPDGWEQAASALICSKNSKALDKMKMFAQELTINCDIAPRRDGIMISSISQLEQYAKCPFAYMVKYALMPKEDVEEDLSAAGAGAFLHEAMERFGRSIKEYDINTLDEDTISRVMEKEAQIIAQNFDNQRLSRDQKGKYIAKSLTDTAKHGALLYVEHMKKSKFIPQEQELEFGDGKALGPIEISLDSGTKVHISGKVDRLDTTITPDGTYARIIDYKSSKRDIRYEKIVSGEQLQLFIYMDAYLSKNQNVKASGVFYFPISHDYIDENDQRYVKDQMQGLFVEDKENIVALDSDINELGKSQLIKAELKNDGSFKAHSNNISKEGFDKVLNYAKTSAKQILSQIDSGNMPVCPIEGNNTSACDYCQYGSICRKDVDLHDRKIEPDKDTARDIIFGGNTDEH